MVKFLKKKPQLLNLPPSCVTFIPHDLSEWSTCTLQGPTIWLLRGFGGGGAMVDFRENILQTDFWQENTWSKKTLHWFWARKKSYQDHFVPMHWNLFGSLCTICNSKYNTNLDSTFLCYVWCIYVETKIHSQVKSAYYFCLSETAGFGCRRFIQKVLTLITNISA